EDEHEAHGDDVEKAAIDKAIQNLNKHLSPLVGAPSAAHPSRDPGKLTQGSSLEFSRLNAREDPWTAWASLQRTLRKTSGFLLRRRPKEHRISPWRSFSLPLTGGAPSCMS